jgi:Zn-dependent M28 family amino/carboxypeptidase
VERKAAVAHGLGTLMVVSLIAGCGGGGSQDAGRTAINTSPVESAVKAMTTGDLIQHIRDLSADSMEGRAPASVGEDRTVAYLTNQFKALGLEPGNPDGTYVQDVPLVGIESQASGQFQVKGQTLTLSYPDNWVAVSKRVTPEVDVRNSDVVFVGYGVVAPEYDWDDYKGRDMTGRTLVMLVNDPPVPEPNEAYKLDPKMFKGDAMTYYGRWTYKYEEGTRKGAAAVIIVHETGPAGYPWGVVTSSWGHENFSILPPDNNMSRVPVEGWITLDEAKQLFSAAGYDFDALKESASKKDFQPVDLGATADFTVKQTTREVQSRNVVAKLPGTTKPGEYVIYTAHWDHLGMNPSLPGPDKIYNGALDNASGVGGLLELGKAFKALQPGPDRSILFLAVTSEEQGLLGSQYYATNPLYPLNKTLADINMDALNQWGPTKDVIVVGMGNTTLEDILRREATAVDRVIEPDAEPEKGFFYRSDQFSFAKQGVPALYTDAGIDYIGKPAGWGKQKKDEYTENDYHKPSDEIKPDWDLTGAIDDLHLLFAVGYDVANATQWPQWKEGTEFKAIREKSLGSK